MIATRRGEEGENGGVGVGAADSRAWVVPTLRRVVLDFVICLDFSCVCFILVSGRPPWEMCMSLNLEDLTVLWKCWFGWGRSYYSRKSRPAAGWGDPVEAQPMTALRTSTGLFCIFVRGRLVVYSYLEKKQTEAWGRDKKKELNGTGSNHAMSFSLADDGNLTQPV